MYIHNMGEAYMNRNFSKEVLSKIVYMNARYNYNGGGCWTIHSVAKYHNSPQTSIVVFESFYEIC
jgi:hypothetical protein